MGVVNAFKRMVSGKKPLASDVNQLIDALSGNTDIGSMQLFNTLATPSTPTVSVNTTAGVLNGNYQYLIVNVTGWESTDGNFYVQGFAVSSASATIAPANQQGNVSWAAGPSGTVAQMLYRTTAGGTTFKFCEWFGNNTTTSVVDNTVDSSLGTGMPTVNGTAIPSTITASSNTTGTKLTSTTIDSPTLTGTMSLASNANIAGINALAHGPSLTALLHFNGSLDTSRGVRGTFTRSSSANNPDTLASEGNNVPSYVTGKWGDAGGALSIWEGTTNLVYNSDFETFTSTATVFSDALTAGTTADPAWTVQSGSFTWSTSGATSGANGAIMTAGNAAWKPLQGNGGQNLALTAQATTTTPSVLGNTGIVYLYVDSQNYYYAGTENNGTTFYLAKNVNGTVTVLQTASVTISASTSYPIVLSYDSAQKLTATLKNSSGTALQTLSATDTAHQGKGMLAGVGGDTGVVISGVSVTVPWADGWTIGGDQRVAWALTSSGAINGGHSVSAVGVASVTGNIYQLISGISASTSYAESAYVETSGVGTKGANIQIDWKTSAGAGISSSIGPLITGTASTNRSIEVATSPSTAGECAVSLLLNDSGTVTFDAIQLEQKPYATPYLRNDSTSSTATRSAETYTLPASLLNAAQGTIAGWINFGTLGNSGNGQCFLSLDGTNRWDFWLFGSDIQHYDGKLSAWTNTGFAPSVNTPLHFVATWDGTNTYIYINGVKMATTANSINLSGASHIYVGSLNTSGYQADGSTDDLHIFSTALTDAQIASLYNATQPTIDDLSTPIAPDTTVYNQTSSSPDANDVYTTVTYTRRDGTTYMTSVLSGTPPSGTSQYPTMTWTYYAADGTTPTRQQTFSLTYDANGKRTGVSMTN